MLTGRVDNRGFQRKAALWAGNTRAAERLVVEALGEQFITRVLRAAPADTHRYKRGWAIAGNQAGAGLHTVPRVRKSRYADKLAARLEQQLADLLRKVTLADKAAKYWTDVYANRYARVNRRDRWERDCRAKKDKAVKRAAKMQELVDFASQQIDRFKNGDAGELVIWGKSTRKDTAKSRYASVRDKVYGGRGTWKTLPGGGTLLELKNLEPHASIVESRTGVVRAALGSLKGAGLRRYTPRMIKLIEGR